MRIAIPTPPSHPWDPLPKASISDPDYRCKVWISIVKRSPAGWC